VADADIGGRWVQVTGKGSRERRVPLDPGVGAVIQAYLLAERPETGSGRLFIVAKGPASGPAADPGGAAADLPLPPRDR
jgi:integrase/recombinase XerD